MVCVAAGDLSLLGCRRGRWSASSRAIYLRWVAGGVGGLRRRGRSISAGLPEGAVVCVVGSVLAPAGTGHGRSACAPTPHIHDEPCCCGPIPVPQSYRQELRHSRRRRNVTGALRVTLLRPPTLDCEFELTRCSDDSCGRAKRGRSCNVTAVRSTSSPSRGVTKTPRPVSCDSKKRERSLERDSRDERRSASHLRDLSASSGVTYLLPAAFRRRDGAETAGLIMDVRRRSAVRSGRARCRKEVGHSRRRKPPAPSGDDLNSTAGANYRRLPALTSTRHLVQTLREIRSVIDRHIRCSAFHC